METNEQAAIAPEATNLPAKVGPVVLPAIPPIPVWDEHIEALEIQAAGFACATAADFAHGKELGTKASTLKRQIEAGYAEVKRAIDAIKAPILDQEKADLAKVATLLTHLDTEAGAWGREQQRLAEECPINRASTCTLLRALIQRLRQRVTIHYSCSCLSVTLTIRPGRIGRP